MTDAAIDPIIHQPIRLRIVSSLTSVQEGTRVDFTYLRDILDVTDGNLGAHLAKLEAAGYISIDKEFVAKKPKSFIALTSQGRYAFARHVAALQAIIDAAGDSTGDFSPND
jgi:DNA-binding MarR family transcriptional regulator